MPKRANIIIGSDICPIGRNEKLFEAGDAKHIFNDLLSEFEQADFSVVNLECPLIRNESPILKHGPVLGVNSGCIKGIKNASIDLVNLANNHIMDHGAQGLRHTLEVCKKFGIGTVGAGRNIDQARQLYTKVLNGIRIAILGLAEHEFSIASRNSYGANPIDIIDYVRNVRSNKKDFDYLIVLLHGGNENYPYPSPQLIKLCHFLVEMGANAVIVQHTHCPGSYERYRNANIVYGQGNLIFDFPNRGEEWYKGFLVKLTIYENLGSEIELVPYVQSRSQPGAHRMGKADEQVFLRCLEERSARILDDTFVRRKWAEFCEERSNFYLSKLLGHNPIVSRLNRKGHIVKYLYFKKSLAATYNVFSTEAHRYVLETIFEKLRADWNSRKC